MTAKPKEMLQILRIGKETSIRGSGISIKEALARTNYLKNRTKFSSSDLLPLVNSHPAVISEWIRCSQDKRTSSGWYLLETGEIGHVSKESERMICNSRECAVAEYVVREMDYWMSVNPPNKRL